MSNVCDTSSALTSPPSAPTRAATALDRLYTLKRNRTPVSLTTPLHTYPRMLLQNVTVTNEAGHCHGFTASITFKEMPDSTPHDKPHKDDGSSHTVRRGRAKPDAASTSVAKRLLEKIGSRILA